MKKLIGLVILVFCSQLTFAEKALIGNIVYDLDLNTLSAMVLNYQTNTEEVCDVVIPSTVEYKHDTYRVTALGYDRLDESYEFYYKYDKARINIEHLHLPNTLEMINTNAFTGMSRLKELVIPESVEFLLGARQGWFNIWIDCPILGCDDREEFPRLESITVLGTPKCARVEDDIFRRCYTISTYYYYDKDKKKVEVPLDMSRYDYVLKVANTIAGIKSLETPTSKLCPNLKTFSMPAAEKKIGPIKQCYSELRTLCNSYNAQLKDNPYYDGLKITYNLLYKGSQPQLRKDCDSIKSAITEQYNRLINGQMESNMRENDLAKYIAIYQTLHPECTQGIDSIRFEYRCEAPTTQDSTILLYIEHNALPLSCREKQYWQCRNLFTDKVEFDAIYNSKQAESFQYEIDYRLKLRPWLDKFIDLVKNNPDAKLQGMIGAKEGTIPCRIYAYLRKFATDYNTDEKRDFFYNEAVNAIFEYNVKANEEFSKNGHFFKSRQEFFDAYITVEYKKILKTKKKN